MQTEEVEEWDLMTLDEHMPGTANKTAKFKNIFLNGKSRVLASLYNIYRRYPTEPPEFTMAPVYLLGHCYHCDDATINQFHYLNHGNEDADYAMKLHNPPHVSHFLRDFQFIVWFSYRKDFPPLGPAQLTSDIGWGCMLRTGQMILAQTLIFHLLGRDWRLTAHEANQPFSIYRQILRLFTDSPSITSPYSVHNIVTYNKAMAKIRNNNNNNNNNYESDTSSTNPFKAEPWFAPSTICKVLRNLVYSYGPNSMTMYVPSDPVIYIDKIVQLCTEKKGRNINNNNNSNINNNNNNNNNNSNISNNSGNSDINNNNNNNNNEEREIEEETVPWRSLFILIPMRLGVDKINPIYFETILACLRMPQSVGIIGGKPKQSFWFVGSQDDYLIFLDPHIVQESLQPNTKFSDESYHCSVPQKIHISEVDPSLAVGFYCNTKDEFDNLCNAVNELAKTSSPIFSIEQNEPVYSDDDSS